MLKKVSEISRSITHSVYSELPSYDLVIPALLESGIKGLEKKCHLTPTIPVHPMLAQPTKGISEVLDRFSGMNFTCEFKYDGERAQVKIFNFHFPDSLFRRQNDENL
jgi:DNA ligase-1